MPVLVSMPYQSAKVVRGNSGDYGTQQMGIYRFMGAEAKGVWVAALHCYDDSSDDDRDGDSNDDRDDDNSGDDTDGDNTRSYVHYMDADAGAMADAAVFRKDAEEVVDGVAVQIQTNPVINTDR
jgi:hypothetical protein